MPAIYGLLCGDRAAVVHQLVDIYRNFGDRHGTALQTIANIATGGTAYDGVGPQSRNGTSYREPMMREAVQLLRQEIARYGRAYGVDQRG